MIEDKMLAIFGGRMDSYGKDVAKNGDPAAGGMRVDGPVTPQLVKRHLFGEIGIGLYPTWHDDDGVLMASWGCCDIDTGDWSEAWALSRALRAMDIPCHIERSRSKGWHIWVFPTLPVTARAMRRALKVAYAAIELPAKEANPKSETLAVGQVGNYVRLPYKGALGGQPIDHTSRQCFVAGYTKGHEGFPIGLADWMYEFDSSCMAPAQVIEKWADRWREPERAEVQVQQYSDEELQKLCSGLRGDLLLFVRNGPKHDRSAGMVALAHKLKAARYTPTEAFNILCVADEQWGKYWKRGTVQRDRYITDILERTYTNA